MHSRVGAACRMRVRAEGVAECNSRARTSSISQRNARLRKPACESVHAYLKKSVAELVSAICRAYKHRVNAVFAQCFCCCVLDGSFVLYRFLFLSLVSYIWEGERINSCAIFSIDRARIYMRPCFVARPIVSALHTHPSFGSGATLSNSRSYKYTKVCFGDTNSDKHRATSNTSCRDSFPRGERDCAPLNSNKKEAPARRLSKKLAPFATFLPPNYKSAAGHTQGVANKRPCPQKSHCILTQEGETGAAVGRGRETKRMSPLTHTHTLFPSLVERCWHRSEGNNDIKRHPSIA